MLLLFQNNERERLYMDSLKDNFNKDLFNILVSILTVIGIIIACINPSSKDKSSEENEENRKKKRWANVSVVILIVFFLVWVFNAMKDSGGNVPPTGPTESIVETTEDSSHVYTVPENDIISSIKASSTYTGDRVSHSVYNLTDNDLNTNWTEGAEGQGIGEYIDFTLKKEYILTEMEIFPGNHRDDNYFHQNSRPREITLTFSDGTVRKVTLEDSRTSQAFPIDPQIASDSVRLTIDSVYPGTKWADTVISQISFSGYPVN